VHSYFFMVFSSVSARIIREERASGWKLTIEQVQLVQLSPDSMERGALLELVA